MGAFECFRRPDISVPGDRTDTRECESDYADVHRLRIFCHRLPRIASQSTQTSALASTKAASPDGLVHYLSVCPSAGIQRAVRRAGGSARL